MSKPCENKQTYNTFFNMSDAIATLLNLVIPPGCNCRREGLTYIITCSSYGTARGVWERRFNAIYPLLQTGYNLEERAFPGITKGCSGRPHAFIFFL